VQVIQGSDEVQREMGAIKQRLGEIQVHGQLSIMQEVVKHLIYGGLGANWGAWAVNGGVLMALVASSVISR
jgi:hypothetical protein